MDGSQNSLSGNSNNEWVTEGLIASIERHLVEHLKPSRVDHIRRVTEMAILLANRYGVDYKLAKLASLLHDIAKYYSKNMVRETLKKYNINDPLLYEYTFLAHGEIGAIIGQEVFGITHMDVLNAVRYHTYGRKGMSLLEKIVFMADYIEEGRDFDGVHIAREKAHSNLDEALLFSVGHSIQYLLKTEAIVHPNSLDVYNECLLAKKRLSL